MTREEFKAAYSAYRKAIRNNTNLHDQHTLEWIESLNPLIRECYALASIIEARAKGFVFARPGNRFGQYGWENMGFKVI